jgi:putative DNA primase/helicase
MTKPSMTCLPEDLYIWKALSELQSASSADWKLATGIPPKRFSATLVRLNMIGCVKFDPEKKAFAPVREPTEADYAKPPKADLPEQLVEPLLKRGSDAEIAVLIARSQLEGAVWDEGKFWKYNGKIWAERPQHELENLVSKYDGEPYGYFADKTVKLNAGRIASIIAILRAKLTKPNFFTNAAVGINCEEGFISFAEDGTPSLEPHSQDHRQRHMMRGTWTPDTNADQSVRNCLQTNFKGDEDAERKIDVIEEATGAAMLGCAAHKRAKAIVLWGETAGNGKSTVLDFISAGVPETALAVVPPKRFGNEKFAYQLAGKQLNAVGELGTAPVLAAEEFKGMITGDKQSARDVYKSVCTFVPTAQHIFACNQLPAFHGGMGWEIQRRLLPIAFNRTIPEEEQNDRLERIPIDYPDAFLAFAVKGASRYLRQKKRFTVPVSSERTLAEWVEDADVVLAWVAQRVAPPLQLKVVGEKPPELTTTECYGDFLDWAEAEGYERSKLPTKDAFSKRVKPALLRKDIPYKRSNHFRGFVGLRLQERTPEMETEAEVASEVAEVIDIQRARLPGGE